MKVNYEELRNQGACKEAIDWLRTKPDVETAWATCNQSDWMLRLLGRFGLLSDVADLRIQLRMLDTPLADGRTVMDLITDECSLAFVDLKRRRVAGEEIAKDVWAAAAAYAAFAAFAAAEAAAYAAYVYDATATTAATAASVAAAYDADDYDAAKAEAREWQANAIREIVPDIVKLLSAAA